MKLSRLRNKLSLIIFIIFLASCSETKLVVHSAKRIIGPSEIEPPRKPIQNYKVGKPYQIFGVWYYPSEDYNYEETGIASWYGEKFHGGKTANGEIFDMNTLSAAHRTLPMPSFVRVTNLENGRSLILRINDRGPFARKRIIDISRRGAQLLGFEKQGTAKIKIQILSEKSREIKYRIQNQAELRRVGSPLNIDRIPKPMVQSQPLPSLINKNIEKNNENVAHSIIKVDPLKKGTVTSKLDPSQPQQINQGIVSKSDLYVQVGAFSKFDNASRIKARLAPIGSVRLSQTFINGRDLYRVRIGPLASVSLADQTLMKLESFGYREAKIIVD